MNIKRIVKDDVYKGILKPEELPFVRWKVDKFKYTDEGITELSLHDDYITKQLWFSASSKRLELIKKSNEYKSALLYLNSVFGENDKLSQALDNFVKRVAQECLENLKTEESNINFPLEISSILMENP